MTARSCSLTHRLLAVAALSVLPVSATVVFTENFNGTTVGQIPTGWSRSTGTDATVSVSANGKDTSNGLEIVDFGTAATSTTATVSATGLNNTNNLLRLTFDFRVTAFGSGGNNQNPRIVLRDSTSSTTANSGMVLGFSTASIADGDSTADNFLFAAPHPISSSSVASVGGSAVQIGLNGATGWQPGFDFGTYDAANSFANGTGEFINFQLVYDFNTGSVVGVATKGANSANFSMTLNAGLTFSNGSFLFASGGSTGSPAVAATSIAYLDNVMIEVIPEPSSTTMVAAALSGAFFIRRRKH